MYIDIFLIYFIL